MKLKIWGILSLALIAAVGMGAAVADDWPQFRGVQRDGISPETGLLASWPESGPKELWRQPLGEGFSGISVVADRVYTMYAGDQDGEAMEFAAAFDAASGKEVWRVALGKKHDTEFGNGPRATPTVDGDTVFFLSSLGDLAALSTKDGSKKWGLNLTESFGSARPHWGFSTSALVDGDHLIIEGGGPEGKAYSALNKKSGEVKWSTGDTPPGYNSVLPIEMNGKKRYVYVVAQKLMAVDENGNEIWSTEWPQGETHAMPIFIEPNRIFASSAEGVGAKLFEINEGKDGTEVKELWATRFMRNHFSSSVLHGDHLYGFDNATLKSMKAEDSELAWAKRGLGKGSLILADNHLYVLSDRGKLLLIEATPSGYAEKGSVQALEGRCWTAPTLANGVLYLRSQTEMVAYRVKG